VEDRSARPKPVPATYSVQRGDTLFSIAWRYGLDYRAIAGRNSISAPYTIYPGQKIYLAQKPPATAKAASATTTKAAVKPAVKQSTLEAGTPPTAIAKSGTSASANTTANTTVSKWRWPTSGRVTRGYSSTVHKGIDIEGRRGDAIHAVAAGKVVYAGAGIVGYGELLIVKHNEVYLSAYGHNNRLLVAEGDRVRAGQKIAEKGSSGTDTVKLHFEIRREGKPIDPQKLLPTK
jgi:lipoprotein NlpD